MDDAILVGGPETTSRLRPGFKHQHSVAEVLGRAQDTVGTSLSTVYMYIPPLFIREMS